MVPRHRHITIVTVVALFAATLGRLAAPVAEARHTSDPARVPEPLAAADVPGSQPANRLPSDTEPEARGSGPTVAQLYADCIEGTKAPTSQVATGGRGRIVALVGDSITIQTRRLLMGDDAHRWVVWSHCGARTVTALAAGAVGAVAAGSPPDVVIMALGTNDAGFPDAHAGAADGFLASALELTDQALQLRPVCVVWLSVAQRGDAELATEMRRVNDALRVLVERDARVHVVDWAGPVAVDSRLLIDRVHLSERGITARANLLKSAVDQCPSAKG